MDIAIKNVEKALMDLKEENPEILQKDLSPMHNLLLDITTLSTLPRKEDLETLEIWMHLLYNSVTQAKSILHRSEQRCLDCLMCNTRTLSKEIKIWKSFFDCIFEGLEETLWMLYRARSKQNSLSTEEAWNLFRTIAFKDMPLSTDIEEYARNIVDECKGFHSAITLVAAAMMGKTSVDEWKTSLASIKNADPDPYFPHTLHRRFDPELYQLLRRGYYDFLFSKVKKCFLCCAMYGKDAEISVVDLVQNWIAEGFVRSKQKATGCSYVNLEATGRSYLNLFVQRCLLQYVAYKKIENVWELPMWERLRVPHVIRDIAIHIGEKEENCVFKADQGLQNFPTINQEDCKRISLRNNAIETLPTEFRCPKLVSLILSSNSISMVPPGFLDSLTSLKVLDLSSNNRIRSIPPSVGNLKQIRLLRLSWLSQIQDLPKEICHLSSLQFLDLSNCRSLESLPSDIGKLKNLLYLNLERCGQLREIPDEISQITSLSTLDAEDVPNLDIRKLKGLGSLTNLRMKVGRMRMEVGIMGTWFEMRHLWFKGSHLPEDMLPEDMQNMRKLQSFILWDYNGFSLPDYSCRFEHLESIALCFCPILEELSQLQLLPNLKFLKLVHCDNLQHLGIGNSSEAIGFLMLEELDLQELPKLESIAGESNSGVWNESTLPRLCILKIWGCSLLKTLPVGMQKLLKLNTLLGQKTWWQNLNWEDDGIKICLEKLFQDWDSRDNQRRSF